MIVNVRLRVKKSHKFVHLLSHESMNKTIFLVTYLVLEHKFNGSLSLKLVIWF